MATYHISVRQLQATPVVFVRANTTRDRLRGAVADALTAAWAHAELEGVPAEGPFFSRYSAREDGSIDFEAGVRVSQAVRGNSAITAGRLPAGEAATLVHVGPYSRLWAAYDALNEWLKVNDRAASEPIWEQYLNDPREVPDPSKWETELVCPLAPQL